VPARGESFASFRKKPLSSNNVEIRVDRGLDEPEHSQKSDYASMPMPSPPGAELSRIVPQRKTFRTPLRICQVIPYALDENGGVKHHALQLAKSLRATGHHVTVVGP
jgi:hypothetical protein